MSRDLTMLVIGIPKLIGIATAIGLLAASGSHEPCYQIEKAIKTLPEQYSQIREQLELDYTKCITDFQGGAQ